MKLKEIRLKRFKRFSDLTITNLPDTASLCLIAGPNGCGKSSFFEALNAYTRRRHFGITWDDTYYVKKTDEEIIGADQAIKLSFHGDPPTDFRKSIYIRSAYRNDPQFELKTLNRLGAAFEENRLPTLIENDATVGKNYQRLATQALEDVFDQENISTTIGEFREKVIGELKCSTERLFPDLVVNSLGNTLTSGTFKFDKGGSKGFSYKNLSGGEKAAFDLILDMIVKRREYDDTIFCIDEPETHMNTRLQGSLLRELFNLIGDKSQLWMATHSIGMMRAARDLSTQLPGKVIFVDFGERDFDVSQTIEPEKPTRAFWQRVLNVGFDDFAALLAPKEVILCEGATLGSPGINSGADAKVYEVIFSDEFPDTRFIAAGNSHSVENDRLALIEAMQALVAGTVVRRLIDRDDMSDTEISERSIKKIAVLKRRHLESYLFDDEVIKILARNSGAPEKATDLITKKQQLLSEANEEPRSRPLDDVKASSGQIMMLLKKELRLIQSGNTVKDFMRITLAPIITKDTQIYKDLKSDVFPSHSLPQHPQTRT